MDRVKQTISRWLIAAGWVYGTGILVWLPLHLLTGDRLWYVSLATSLAHHFFWPLPVLVVLAVFTHRRSLWVLSGVISIVWLALFGGLFIRRASPALSASHTIQAMTYNLAYSNTDVEAVAATIQEADADVVGLQELSPAMAAVLAPALEDTYPHQWFEARPSVTGMGIVSRYPFQVTSREALTGFWIGEPQAIQVDAPGGPVMMLNVHFAQGRHRDANAAKVAAWVESQDEPVVVIGDMNATDLSDAYELLEDAGLHDAWREDGWGYGSTFPAAGVLVVRGRRLRMPGPLVRIDFVMHSDDFRVLEAQRLPWDGNSDHLAVVAELLFSDK